MVLSPGLLKPGGADPSIPEPGGGPPMLGGGPPPMRGGGPPPILGGGPPPPILGPCPPGCGPGVDRALIAASICFFCVERMLPKLGPSLVFTLLYIKYNLTRK